MAWHWQNDGTRKYTHKFSKECNKEVKDNIKKIYIYFLPMDGRQRQDKNKKIQDVIFHSILFSPCFQSVKENLTTFSFCLSPVSPLFISYIISTTIRILLLYLCFPAKTGIKLMSFSSDHNLFRHITECQIIL